MTKKEYFDHFHFLFCLEAKTSKLYNLTNSSNNTCLLKRTTSRRKFRRYWKVRKTKENQIIKKEIYTDLKGHSLDHLRDVMHGGTYERGLRYWHGSIKN